MRTYGRTYVRTRALGLMDLPISMGMELRPRAPSAPAGAPPEFRHSQWSPVLLDKMREDFRHPSSGIRSAITAQKAEHGI